MKDNLIIQAIRESNKEFVVSAKARKHWWPNKRLEGQFTALHTACAMGKVDMINFLVSLGANPNALDNFGWSPLDWAVYNNSFKAVSAIAKHAQVNSHSLTPFLATAYGSETQTTIVNPTQVPTNARLLKSNFVESDRGDYMVYESSWAFARNLPRKPSEFAGTTPLHKAIKLNKIKALEALVHTKKVDINAVDYSGNTPLHTAAGLLLWDAIDFLFLDSSINPNAQNRQGDSPLHMVAGTDRQDMLSYLHKNGANLHLRNHNQQTPLFNLKQYTMLDYFIKAGADINAQDKNLQTPLFRYIHHNPLLTKEALKQGADPSMQDKDGNTVLHLAARNGQLNIVRILLNDPRVNINAVNHKGQSPLHIAHPCCVKPLFEEGANINLADNDGDTPLHIATSKHDIEKTKVLLAHNANPNALNNAMKTPFGLSIEKFLGRIIFSGKYIEHNGEDFLLADFKPEQNICKMLLDKGARFDIMGNDGAPINPGPLLHSQLFDNQSKAECRAVLSEHRTKQLVQYQKNYKQYTKVDASMAPKKHESRQLSQKSEKSVQYEKQESVKDLLLFYKNVAAEDAAACNKPSKEVKRQQSGDLAPLVQRFSRVKV